ncbi:hypothetical protein WJX81_004438 [Elliptochloris bilobata]|uniref:Uncharacterized protein n=1 Tax=Elliptochloris bilobata TaxID=381761 RepID=A0AAW1SGF3_9CHLO
MSKRKLDEAATFLERAGSSQVTEPLYGSDKRLRKEEPVHHAPSVPGSEASEATMQASTPLSQGGWLQQQGGWLQQQGGGLQRSNSAPDLRVLLAAPLQPLLSIPPAFVPPQYASASTAGALVPYKAPEGNMLF